eukprot:333337_1
MANQNRQIPRQCASPSKPRHNKNTQWISSDQNSSVLDSPSFGTARTMSEAHPEKLKNHSSSSSNVKPEPMTGNEINEYTPMPMDHAQQHQLSELLAPSMNMFNANNQMVPIYGGVDPTKQHVYLQPPSEQQYVSSQIDAAYQNLMNINNCYGSLSAALSSSSLLSANVAYTLSNPSLPNTTAVGGQTATPITPLSTTTAKGIGLCIENMPPITQNDLQKRCEKYGSLVQCKIDGKGQGLVMFASAAERLDAMKDMNNKPWNGDYGPNLRISFIVNKKRAASAKGNPLEQDDKEQKANESTDMCCNDIAKCGSNHKEDTTKIICKCCGGTFKSNAGLSSHYISKFGRAKWASY